MTKDVINLSTLNAFEKIYEKRSIWLDSPSISVGFILWILDNSNGFRIQLRSFLSNWFLSGIFDISESAVLYAVGLAIVFILGITRGAELKGTTANCAAFSEFIHREQKLKSLFTGVDKKRKKRLFLLIFFAAMIAIYFVISVLIFFFPIDAHVDAVKGTTNFFESVLYCYFASIIGVFLGRLVSFKK